MKHPRLETLQDYFENALNTYQETLVKEHLLNCDTCTTVLGQMAAVEKKLSSLSALKVSEGTERKIFENAQALLTQKRLRKEEKQNVLDQRREDREKAIEYVRTWWTELLPELKVPALQVCSLSLILAVVVAVEKQNVEEEVYQPISTNVEVLTYKDVPSDEEKP